MCNVSNYGVLQVSVWPTYLGLSTGDPGPGPSPVNEPFGEPGYERGQIFWRTEADQVVGNARVYVPKGVYTHLVFCYGPIQDMQAGSNRLEQPIIFDAPGWIDVDPIQNQDYLPR